jgi:predicted enzyme related to lactoylglutathione lyase
MNRVVHFEIHASDPERAIKFYTQVFGWEIKEWVVPGVELPQENRYWMAHTGNEKEPGIHGGLVIRRGPEPVEGQPVNSFVCTIEINSVDRYLEKAVEAGGTIAVPKMPIPGVGWLAYCKDTEGNLFGIMHSDEKAG